MDINYELYKVFYHVASTLSFSEASKQLFISQSAVSQSIKVLEKKLNQTLFIRSTKSTAYPGRRILLKHVEPAMNLIRQGENQLLDSNSLNGGQLRIGAKRYDLPLLSGAIFKRISQALPEYPHQGYQPYLHRMCTASGQRSGRFYSDELSKLRARWNAEYPCAARIQRYIRRQ